MFDFTFATGRHKLHDVISNDTVVLRVVFKLGVISSSEFWVLFWSTFKLIEIYKYMKISKYRHMQTNIRIYRLRM